MMRVLALSLLFAVACSADLPGMRPELALEQECYEAVANPATGSRICAFQENRSAEVTADTAMGRLTVQCDSTKVRVEVQRRTADKEFREVTCNADDIQAELICGWHTTFHITAFQFGEGTTEVVILSYCDTHYGGKRCLSFDAITPHANFGSTEGHCASGDMFIIDGIAPGDELEAWADPID